MRERDKVGLCVCVCVCVCAPPHCPFPQFETAEFATLHAQQRFLVSTVAKKSVLSEGQKKNVKKGRVKRKTCKRSSLDCDKTSAVAAETDDVAAAVAVFATDDDDDDEDGDP
ncbi:MAG: hypothetical protein ACK41O_26465 [Runella zeae]